MDNSSVAYGLTNDDDSAHNKSVLKGSRNFIDPQLLHEIMESFRQTQHLDALHALDSRRGDRFDARG